MGINAVPQVWDETQPGVFVFTTLSHIKYTIVNGDYGIINSKSGGSLLW